MSSWYHNKLAIRNCKNKTLIWWCSRTSLCTVRLSWRATYGQRCMCAFRNEYLFAASRVCSADLAAHGAILFTQTPILESWLFQAERVPEVVLVRGNRDFLGRWQSVMVTKLNLKRHPVDLEMFSEAASVVIMSYCDKNTVELNVHLWCPLLLLLPVKKKKKKEFQGFLVNEN